MSQLLLELPDVPAPRVSDREERRRRQSVARVRRSLERNRLRVEMLRRSYFRRKYNGHWREALQSRREGLPVPDEWKKGAS